MMIGTTGNLARHAALKAPGRNGFKPGLRSKVPSGKNAQGFAAHGGLQQPSRGSEPMLAVFAVHELRADSLQQEPAQRERRQFVLDEIGELGGEGCGKDDPVQITGMVGHHDAGSAGKLFGARHTHRAADEPEDNACTPTGHPAPRAEVRGHEQENQRGDRRRQQHGPGIGAVRARTSSAADFPFNPEPVSKLTPPAVAIRSHSTPAARQGQTRRCTGQYNSGLIRIVQAADAEHSIIRLWCNRRSRLRST